MSRNRKLLAAKLAVILAVPAILWALSSGPDAHHTAVPGTGETSCNSAGCHVGTALNGGGGNVTITASEGTTYTPGQKQTLTIKITDSVARVYGFQMTARLKSDHNKQAGTFSTGNGQLVLCATTTLSDAGGFRTVTNTCKADSPLEFIEQRSPFTTGTISVDWTPPSSSAGPIEFYVSASAANGNGTEAGDHIYTASLTLAPPPSPKPLISAGGIINAFGFGGKPGVAPGTWIEIYGQNFSSTTRSWANADFNGSNAPKSLDNISVTVAGKSAFLDFISPGQINAQVPDGIGTGPVPVIVTNNGTDSAPVTLTASDTLPGILSFATKVGDIQYAVVQLPDNSFAGDPAKLPGTSRPAKPGETIVLYGIGFGPVNPVVTAGTITPLGPNNLGNSVTGNLSIRFGQFEATDIAYKGLTPNFVGLYQFNVVVPSALPDGDAALDITINGIGTGQSLSVPIKK